MKLDRYEQRKKRVNIIITIVVGFLMVASIFAYVIFDTGQSNNELSYNKFTFQTVNNGYRTKINGAYYDFTYYPSELERINISNDIAGKLMNAQGIIFVFDPNETIDNLQYSDYVRLDLSKQLTTPVIFGITEPSNTYTSMMVLGCTNATAQYPFILLNISSSSTFEQDSKYPDCIIMNAKLKEIIALKDRLVYRMLGVMTN